MVPSERCTMKSPMVSFATSTGPRSRSSKAVVPGRTRKAQRPRLAGGLAAGDLVGRQVATGAAVDPGALVGLRRPALGLELLGRVEAGVQVAAGKQPVDVLAVDRLTLGLAVRAVGAGLLGAFVPVELHLAQRAQDLGDGLVGRARRVGVFDAQDEVAAVLAGEDVVVQGGARPAQVKVAGGRRCKADANGLGHGGPFYPTAPLRPGRRPARGSARRQHARFGAAAGTLAVE